MCRTTALTAARGGVNRPGNSAPAVKPTTHRVTSATTPTATGHSGGPPQATARAVWIYSTVTAARNASTSQNIVPVSAASRRGQGGRAVVASRSPVFRRPSRAPTQADRPPANAAKSRTSRSGTARARMVQIGGYPLAVR
jgi:hypothetical protein